MKTGLEVGPLGPVVANPPGDRSLRGQGGRVFRNRIFNASVLVAFFFALDKLFALARQYLAAQAFGLSSSFDAFNVANNLPDAIVAVFAAGGLAFALIPVLTETLDQQGEAGVWRLFSSILNIVLLVTVVLAAGIAVFAEPLVRYGLAPSFAPEQQQLVTQLMRFNLIATLIFAVSGLMISGLQAHRHFLLPALAPIAYHIGQIVGLVFLVPHLGIYGLLAGVILGAVGHLLVQLPGLWHYQFQWTPRIHFRDPALRRILTLVGPRLMTIALIQGIFIVNDRLASQFDAGAISALYYGWGLMQLPETIIGTAAGTVLLPTLSLLAAEGRAQELQRLLRRSLGILLVLTLPITVLGIVLVRPAVALVLEGRAFTPAHGALVSLATQMYLVGLVGQTLKEIATRTFYAHKEAVVQVYTAALNIGVFVVGSYLLIPRLNFAALALANSLGVLLETSVMLWVLHRRRIL